MHVLYTTSTQRGQIMAIEVDNTLHNDVLLSHMRTKLISINERLDSMEDRKTSQRLISAIERLLADDFYMAEWNSEIEANTDEAKRKVIDQKYIKLREDARGKVYHKIGNLMARLHSAWLLQ